MKYSRGGYWGLPAAAIAMMIFGILVMQYAMPHGHSWPKALILSVIAIACAAVAMAGWRHADEVLLHTHQTAWFWGSHLGVAVLLPFVIAMGWDLVPIPHFSTLPLSPATGLVAGFGLTLLAQFIGYLVFCYHKRILPH